MHTTIASLDGIAYEGECVMLAADTTTGEITVLPGHHPLLTLLAEGTLRATLADGQTREFQVQSGTLEVAPDGAVNVLVN